jgi:two-component system sensor histidine kinase RegB
MVSDREESAASVERISAVALPWLIRLRWGAVVGQTVTIATAQLVIGASLPLSALLTVVGAIAASNVLLVLLVARRWETVDELAHGVLVADTLALAWLLALSGGTANPFTMLFMVHVVVAVVLLSPAWTWIIAALALACYGAMSFWSFPLVLPSAVGGVALDLPLAYRQGLAVAFGLTVLLIALFAGQILAAWVRRERQLATMREESLQHQQLVGLTTLAAGAAHELGSPLGTIAVAAGEMERVLAGVRVQPELATLVEDVQLIREEVDRCRAILDHMYVGSIEDHAPRGDLNGTLADLRRMLGESAWSRVALRCPSELLARPAPVRTLAQALIAPLRNALQATCPGESVTLAIEQRPAQLVFQVRDQGAGMASEILARASEPFFTTRKPGEGMGLGLFLTRVIADRLGGQLTIQSRPGGGTVVQLVIPDLERISCASSVSDV